MLFAVCYIIPHNVCQQSSLPLVRGTYAFEIDGTTETSLLLAYQQVSKLPIQQAFCLYIKTLTELNKKQAEDLISFFFFPNFYKVDHHPFLLLENNDEAQNSTFIEILSQQGKAQGYHQLAINLLCTNTNSPNIIYKASDETAISQAAVSFLQASGSITETLYIKIGKAEDIVKVQSILEQEEQLFKDQNPRLYELMVKNKELTVSIERLQQIVEAAGKELQSQAAHMKVLRSSSQATHLQYYYNNEYEVLPSWYKQFGHLLKVVLGKRSFRSLFSDNVKKYKQ